MKIIIFTHPSFLGSQSMPRYANMLLNGMKERGHEVQVWTPKARFSTLPSKHFLKKWLGYIDQYLVFPLEVKFRLRSCSKDSLFVFADQALGPWVPLVKNRPHVVHCHDFLALKSALGRIPENPTGFTGIQYQDYIRNGFSKAKHFICISQKTKEDLHQFHRGNIESATVCYNGLNRHFQQLDPVESRHLLTLQLQIELSSGYVMHIGGNQYYKNRKGVLEIYEEWRNSSTQQLPLLMIGSQPTTELMEFHEKLVFKKDIYFISNLSDEYINASYSGATCLLFPSLDEGFGWPIVEAMASGCPVITTNKAPMNEVGGAAAFYVDKKPTEANNELWKSATATVLGSIVSLSAMQRKETLDKSSRQSHKFNSKDALDAIEDCYKKILLAL
jgi:glycosyltransferase involved in cell wall biosynthesis